MEPSVLGKAPNVLSVVAKFITSKNAQLVVQSIAHI